MCIPMTQNSPVSLEGESRHPVKLASLCSLGEKKGKENGVGKGEKRNYVRHEQWGQLAYYSDLGCYTNKAQM